MFAFALHDPRSMVTLLVRDRVGVKPLYFGECSEGIMFASQPTALLAWPSMRAKPDPIGVSSFLSYRAVLGSRSLFAGVSKLEPGHLAIVHEGRVDIQRWWRPPSHARDDFVDPETVRALIGAAVEEQLVSDVPLAALLSGGLDSSILAYEIITRSSARPVCFTGAVQSAEYDETPFAREVAQHLGLEHQCVPIPNPVDLSIVSELIARRCHPLAGLFNAY